MGYYKTMFLPKKDYNPVVHYLEVEERHQTKHKADSKGVNKLAQKKGTVHFDAKTCKAAPVSTTSAWGGGHPKVPPSAPAGSAASVTPGGKPTLQTSCCPPGKVF